MERAGSLLSVGRRWSAEPLEEESSPTDQQPLRLTAIHDPPYLYISRQPNGSYAFDGYLYQLWEIIARELRLRYRIEPLLDGGYGSQDENGTWTGLVGELAAGRADLALSGIIFRPDRHTVADFIDSVAVSEDRPTFYLRRGSGAARRLTPAVFESLLKPLHAHVWWLVLVCLLLTSLVLCVTVRLGRGRSETRRTASELTWGACLLLTFMTLVNQGWARTPDSLAARTATVAGWVLGMLVYHTYTANLISYLTVTTVNRPIGSLRQLAEQSGWTFAMEPGYGILNTWKRSSDPYERALYARTVTGEGYHRLDITDESVWRTVEPKVVTYIDIERLLKSVGAEGCQLVPLLSHLPPKSSNYMPIAKGRNKLRQAINRLMEQLNQAGIISKLKNTWLGSEQSRCEYPHTSKSLAATDLMAILIIIPTAVVVVLAIWVMECIISRTAHRSPLHISEDVKRRLSHGKRVRQNRAMWKKRNRRFFSTKKAPD